MTNQFCKEQTNQPLIAVLTILLNSIVQSVDYRNMPPTIFDCRDPPKTPIGNYIRRMYKYMSCSQASFIIALIYLDRIQEENPEFYLTQRNIHKMIMTAVVVATKYNQDIVYKTDYYSKISGFGVGQLNKLERRFLEMMSFKSYISPKFYNCYKQKIQKYMSTENNQCDLDESEGQTTKQDAHHANKILQQ